MLVHIIGLRIWNVLQSLIGGVNQPVSKYILIFNFFHVSAGTGSPGINIQHLMGPSLYQTQHGMVGFSIICYSE